MRTLVHVKMCWNVSITSMKQSFHNPLWQRQRNRRTNRCTISEAVASLNLAIQKISTNERDMKTVLQQTKTVLEDKLSEIDQRLEKADNIVSYVNNTSQSLVQLQMAHN